jgi:hypothetical protein
VVHPSDLCSSLDSFGFPFNIGKKRRKCLITIWQVVIWTLWKAINDCIFDGKIVSVQALAQAIKHVSLRLFLAKGIPPVCCRYK